MSTLVLSNKLFPDGDPLPGGGTFPGATPGYTISQSAWQTFSLQDPADPKKFLTYVFLFWNVSGANNSGIGANVNVQIQMGNQDVNATAWYVLTGGNGPWSGVNTWAFSEGSDANLADVPIDHVNPAAAWVPGDKYVKTVTATGNGVDIFATAAINAEVFDLWLTFGGGGTVAGSKLHANEKAAIWAAIAFYKQAGPIRGPRVDETTEPGPIRIGDEGPDERRILEHWYDRITKENLKELPIPKGLNQVIQKVDKMSVKEIRSKLAEITAQLSLLNAEKLFLNQRLNIRKGAQKKPG